MDLKEILKRSLASGRRILCWLGLHSYGDGICLPPGVFWGDDDSRDLCVRCGKKTYVKPFICYFLGHNTGDWIQLPDKFLHDQFDPTGIHFMHSHYRPNARWSRLAQLYPERYDHQECRCKRCDDLVWEFYPINLAGTPWGPGDEYEDIMKAMWFENQQFKIPTVRW